MSLRDKFENVHDHMKAVDDTIALCLGSIHLGVMRGITFPAKLARCLARRALEWEMTITMFHLQNRFPRPAGPSPVSACWSMRNRCPGPSVHPRSGPRSSR
jgi:hypothetical protein